MSTSERLIDNRFAKQLALTSAVVPAMLLTWDAVHHQLGVNDVNFAIRTTGLIGLILLTVALAITPLRALTGWNRLIPIRRNVGVLAFCYLAAHFTIFFLWDRQGSVTSTLTEIVKRRYLWFGAGALTLMLPLALTSTDGMITRLGAKRWKRLQRLVYVIAIAAVVHYYLLVKADVRQPLVFAAIVAALLLYRATAHYVGLRSEVRTLRQHAATAHVDPPKKKLWSGELALARIFDETPDVKTFRLVAVDGGLLPFTHIAGQYLTLALTIDGQRVNRSYTIASSPTRNGYCEISVKCAPNGYGSRHLHETWREGQRVAVSAPAGRFVFAGHEAERIVLIGGGIGVTPLMSVVRSLTDRGWRGEIYLLFSVRQVHDIVFRDELTYLQARFPNLHVRIFIGEDPEAAWDGPRGRITAEAIATFVPGLTRGPVMVCGPPPMMTAMRALLVGMGVPDAEVVQEAFVSRPPVESTPHTDAPVATQAMPDGAVATIVFARSGKTTQLPADQTVLEAAEAAGVDLPFDCRSGICGQCKTRLLAGQVTMDVQDALTAADRSDGFILACQAHATGEIEIDV